jgi:hypothetical protein
MSLRIPNFDILAEQSSRMKRNTRKSSGHAAELEIALKTFRLNSKDFKKLSESDRIITVARLMNSIEKKRIAATKSLVVIFGQRITDEILRVINLDA